MTKEIPYLSHELELFEKAVNWKKYFSSYLIQYISGDVLEVGAGIGTTTPYLLNNTVKKYTCIEPVIKQANVIKGKIDSGILPAYCKIQNSILKDTILNQFDSIVYIDVIEHIEDDVSEIKKATDALKSGGYLCILVPANPADYSSFDKAIGHYRRYDKKMLLNVIPHVMEVKRLKYLDICGSLSSKMNKFFLKQSYPNEKQIFIWDKIMIPVSRLLDPLTGYNCGKSLLLVCKKK